MKRVRWFRVLGLAAIPWMFSLSLAAQGDLAAIQQKLNAQFHLTVITADRSDIVTPGDIVQIHKPGLLMYAVASPLPPSNTYKNGKIGQGWGGFGKDLAIGLAAPGGATAKDYPHRTFVPEEKCWVLAIAVRKDSVVFRLYSDPYDDVRYYADLKIPFPNKKEVPSLDVAMQTVAEVLTVVPQDQGDQGGQPAPAPASGAATITAQGGQPAGFSGDYFSQSKGMHVIFFPDGSLKMVGSDGKMHSAGPFTVSGEVLTLGSWSSSNSLTVKIEGDRLLFPQGFAWVRVGDAKVPTIASPSSPWPAFSGEYLGHEQGKDIHTTYFPNGSFQTTIPGGSGLQGQFQIDGNSLVYTNPMAIAGERDSIQGDRLVSNDDPSSVAVRVGDAPEQAPAETPVSAPSPAPMAPMAPIAPPPPPPDAPPPTITLGQTMDQVTAGFGQPLRVAKLGTKAIFYYKDMKVTFVNGKVTNIE